MPTIGTDCQLILDGTGYWIEPTSYRVHRPRVRRADHTGTAAQPGTPGIGAGERYIDRGPGKRVWIFTVLGYQAMRDYAGNTAANTGTQYHDALRTSYNKVNAQLAFTDPVGQVYSVRFDDLTEDLADIRSQVDAAQWLLHVTLVEA